MASRIIRDGEAWTGERPSRLALPLLILAALLSAILVILASGNAAIGAGFGAMILAAAELLSW